MFWDGTGLCLFTKRLEKGRFPWPAAGESGGTVAPARFLATLCEHELADRHQRRIARHMAQSGLPRGKSVASFEFAAVKSLNKAKVLALAAADAWLDQGANLLIFGPSPISSTMILMRAGRNRQAGIDGPLGRAGQTAENLGATIRRQITLLGVIWGLTKLPAQFGQREVA